MIQRAYTKHLYISMYKYFWRSIHQKNKQQCKFPREILSKQWAFYQRFSVFRLRNYYAFCLLDTSCEKDIGIAVILVVCGFSKCRDGKVPRSCFTTHKTQNKKLLPLKQWHLKIGYTNRTVSFNAFKQYILLP